MRNFPDWTSSSGKIQPRYLALFGALFLCAGFYALQYSYGTTVYDKGNKVALTASAIGAVVPPTPPAPTLPPLDTAAYDAKILALANGDTSGLWPVKTAYPLAGAVLPFSRIVAYYGNFYSTKMGILGEYPPAEVLTMLSATVAQWQAADPSTPVIPAIHYIAITAQGYAGADGMYRLRMPDSQIDQAVSMAAQIHGLVFLDVQVGDSTVQQEVPTLEKYLEMPNVELGIDPEFSMKDGAKPGTVIGTMDASDINFVIKYLAGIVTANNIPPKILVIHRFTQDMVTNYKNIAPVPQVQVVMNMDGYGAQPQKLKAYEDFIEDEPVEFTGMKLFYKNDTMPPSTGLLTPAQLLKLTPVPIYIQYQ